MHSVRIHPRHTLTRKIEGAIEDLLSTHYLKVGNGYEDYLAVLCRVLWDMSGKPSDETPLPWVEVNLRKLFAKLTYGERMAVIGRQLSGSAKYIIREERHPEDPSRPGDVE